jgi:transposase
MAYPRISDEDFIRAWMSSRSQREVATKIGQSNTSVYLRARRMRARGVDLPRLESEERKGVQELNAMIKKLGDVR